MGVAAERCSKGRQKKMRMADKVILKYRRWEGAAQRKAEDETNSRNKMSKMHEEII